MLKCSDGSYYTGHTQNLEQRFSQHQLGTFRGYTYERRPVELVWADYFETRADAQIAETKLKGWSRARKEALIAENWDRLKKLSVPPSERAERTSASLGIVPRLRSGKRELETAVPPPIIILVRPQLGENIGKAARAMLNFGLTEMRLVAPRDGWPNPTAGPAASGADIVLANAQVFGTLAEAIADINHIYATTVRKRGVTKPVITPEAAASEILQNTGRSAILFGAERSGLDSDEVTVARAIITVPINPEFGSLNLAQAVILCAYEWSKTQSLASPPKTDLDPPASQFELDGLIGQLDTMLESLGYFTPVDRAPVTRRTLRNLLTKPAWNSLEVRTLRGVLTTLAKHRRVTD
jgi:tRNA/rRNA methyltransferase